MAQAGQLYNCLLCGRTVSMAGFPPEARHIRAWDMMVCNHCYLANERGIVPGAYPRLDAHLIARGLSPRLNSHGWMNWPKQ